VSPDETLALDAALGWNVNASTKFGGTAPLKFGRAKNFQKFSTFYDNFRVWPRISLKPMKIWTKSKRRWREGSFGRWTKKIVKFRPQPTKLYALILTYFKSHFSKDHTSAPRGSALPNFTLVENDQVLLAHPLTGTGAFLTIFLKGGSKIGLKCNKGALITSDLGDVAWRNFGTCCASRLGW